MYRMHNFKILIQMKNFSQNCVVSTINICYKNDFNIRGAIKKSEKYVTPVPIFFLAFVSILKLQFKFIKCSKK